MSSHKKEEQGAQPFSAGWREWCALPELHLPAIKAKMDTGARTSAIHAFDIEAFTQDNSLWVRFNAHPIQGDEDLQVQCVAPVVDQRPIMSSTGHKEQRYIIATQVQFGSHTWNIELSLSNREPMRFRLLIGREALKGRVVVDPKHSYLINNYSLEEQRAFYTHRR